MAAKGRNRTDRKMNREPGNTKMRIQMWEKRQVYKNFRIKIQGIMKASIWIWLHSKNPDKKEKKKERK